MADNFTLTLLQQTNSTIVSVSEPATPTESYRLPMTYYTHIMILNLLLALHRNGHVGCQILLTDSITQTTFQVMKDKHDRQQAATNQELLNKETGFRHILAYLYSTLFTEAELKVSSVDASVRGTKAFDLVRVAAIDKHLFDLYGARYAKFRTSYRDRRMRIRHHRLRAGIRQLNDGCYQSAFCCKIALDFDRGVPTLLPIRSYC
ncbi:unnamed protein product [Rotaria magnacalcarata]